jgi:hypothetical protein
MDSISCAVFEREEQGEAKKFCEIAVCEMGYTSLVITMVLHVRYPALPCFGR